MNEWFITVLISVRDMSLKSGMPALAEELDVAILVAANEVSALAENSAPSSNENMSIHIERGAFPRGLPH